MTSSNQEVALKELSDAWLKAQEQLTSLRAKVEQLNRLASTHNVGEMLRSELDEAYRELGAVIYQAVTQGKMSIPSGLSEVLDAVAAVEAELRAHREGLTELLAEGAEIAHRMGKKSS